MGNSFRHVRRGEPISLAAEAYNAMLDAAQANRSRSVRVIPSDGGRGSLFFHVANMTGKPLRCFDAAGLDGPLSPDGTGSDSSNFYNGLLFRGIVPREEHRGKFAVIQQDAEPGDIVRACLYGVTPVRIRLKDGEEPAGCDIEPGQTDYLVPGGGAELLWHDREWGIIRLGGAGNAVHDGVLADACAAGAETVRIQTLQGGTIEAAVPYPKDVQASSKGHPCRYYRNGSGWVVLDMACQR
jgi:hypothetical protein